jgi:hypothetical protein
MPTSLALMVAPWSTPQIVIGSDVMRGTNVNDIGSDKWSAVCFSIGPEGTLQGCAGYRECGLAFSFVICAVA